MVWAKFLGNDALHPTRETISGAMDLAERLPGLIPEAVRVTASLAHGLHGRRRSGTGETFWQFRPFMDGEPAGRIDWRRSGRDHRLYVREREWEAAHTIWLWIDQSSSMAYVSELALAAKIDRALVLGLALAGSLVEAGERVGLLGLTAPLASRRIIEKLAAALTAGGPASGRDKSPIAAGIGRRDEVVLISDFLKPLDELEETISLLSTQVARGHILLVADPVEEQFPFSGQAILQDGEQAMSLRIGDAVSWGEEYRKRLTAFREGLAAIVKARGWSLTIHRTDRPASEAALHLLTHLGTGYLPDINGQQR